MKLKPILTLSLAVVSLVLLCPKGVQAQESSNDPSAMTSSNTGTNTNSIEQQMVPAEAALKGTLDAKKVQAGDHVEAVLTGKVHLKNGTELPRGTALIGKIATDHMHPGSSKLTLRFTEAKLKDGRQVPIQAAIVGVQPPATGPNSIATISENPWDGKTIQFDDEGVMSGVDLHSRINGQNSGTFVSDKKDVKLTNGSQLALVIGPKGNA